MSGGREGRVTAKGLRQTAMSADRMGVGCCQAKEDEEDASERRGVSSCFCQVCRSCHLLLAEKEVISISLRSFSQSHVVTAFCSHRLDPQVLTQVLSPLGFRLSLYLQEKTYSNLPPAPAQYHYQHVDGTEVIYLHGQDADDHTAPAHAARLWLYEGHHIHTAQQVMSLTTCQFALSWHTCQSVMEAIPHAS